MTIISGGQTGVDRAALDVALQRGLPCGGWCPRGRLAEDGPLPARYPLRQTATAEYRERTIRNVVGSDATLVLVRGEPTGGTAFTIQTAQARGRPSLVVDLAAADVTPKAVGEWLARSRVLTLNVAGPRESGDPGIYQAARDYLDAVLRFNHP